MQRIHAFEFEDEPWFPRPLRDGLTDFLQVVSERLHLFDAIAPILRDVLVETGARRIVDLCSGGGGPLVALVRCLEREHGCTVPAVLTDKYPNEAAFAAAVQRSHGQVSAIAAPVDATEVPETLDGVRTLFNAFHHFRPEQAAKILADAARKQQPLCIFEIVARDPAALALIAATPLACAALAPFARPFKLSRIALTYAVPLLPLFTLWDGTMSCLRAYGRDELLGLTRQVPDATYQWRVGSVPVWPFYPARITYLIGTPRARDDDALQGASLSW
jgi:SAM-dependent methyltransferase